MNFTELGIHLAGEMGKIGITHDVLTRLSGINLDGGSEKEHINIPVILGAMGAGLLMGLGLYGIQPKGEPKTTREKVEMIVGPAILTGIVGLIAEVVRTNS